ncbi:I78 family peptidase inhibitor [Sphingomonas sp.]|uniref:I78 family peptidase inhibitor n=1 Tax=Sphingomonas sp. TaxID=28214 RepID=UPI0039C93B89
MPLFAFAAVACAPDGKPRTDHIPVRGSGKCAAKGLDDLIGKFRTDAIAAEAKRRSGAGTVRWIGPGQMITMDYRQDRLDIRVDAIGVILSLSCG